MEGSDGYIIAGNTITVTMSVTQPGDWIRVITQTNCQKSAVLRGSGVPGEGLDDAPGLQQNFKPRACANAGKK